MALLAQGSDYFGKNGFPVTARRVETTPDKRPSHPHDVTEIDHYHDFCELVLVLQGRGRHVLEGESFPVFAGDVFLLQGLQVHSFRDRDGLVLLNVMYDPARLSLPVDLLRRLPGYSAIFLLEPTFRSTHRFSSRLQLAREELGAAEALAERIEEESAAAAPGHEAQLTGLLTQLMVLLSRRYGESETHESQALLLMGGLISTLEQRYREEWDLARLAKVARLSRTSLLRVFRQATGKSPIDYLICLRIEAAKRLLRQSDLGMTDIALETGFNDGNYFTRQFRRATGRTPTAFRRQSRPS